MSEERTPRPTRGEEEDRPRSEGIDSTTVVLGVGLLILANVVWLSLVGS